MVKFSRFTPIRANLFLKIHALRQPVNKNDLLQALIHKNLISAILHIALKFLNPTTPIFPFQVKLFGFLPTHGFQPERNSFAQNNFKYLEEELLHFRNLNAKLYFV